jgi:hypothetical protein
MAICNPILLKVVFEGYLGYLRLLGCAKHYLSVLHQAMKKGFDIPYIESNQLTTILSAQFPQHCWAAPGDVAT